MLRLAIIILVIYLGICILLYFIQERLIFFPEKTTGPFLFNEPFEEITIKTRDGVQLNSVLFKARESSRGVIFYLHGNAGSIASWSGVAGIYNSLGYDVYMLDYRGYGKSEGTIRSEKMLHDDVQAAYDAVKQRYTADEIVILGYSLGSGLAARLAAENDCRLLILQAPYYSFTRIMYDHYKILPPLILKYKLRTHTFLPKVRSRVVIFHGRNDELIGFHHAEMLRKYMKPADSLIPIDRLGHNGMSSNSDYISHVTEILRRQ